MRYGSVCSGIEAATAAWHSLGWTPSWFSEIENFPSAVLAHHYPDVPNYGDMTKFKDWPDDKSIDLLVGGTPCQSFSVAGLRKGLDDPRGNLMLTYLAIAAKYRPGWLAWENVPGVLSSNGGRDFGTFLWALGELGYGFAYRTLDAQYFGVAQRRRRVFVVGYLGDWRRAAAVLFERHSLSGNTAPRRKKREEASGYTSSSFGNYSEGVGTVRASGGDLGGGSETLVAKCLTSRVGQAYDAQTEQFVTKFVPAQEKVGTLTASYGMGGVDIETKPVVFGAQKNMKVRRLTPIECERLQGFPDDYTRIPYRNKDAEQCPDGTRYKAIGNSMAVPVMRWIGERIEKVRQLQ